MKPKILIVEDDFRLRKVISEELNSLEMETFEAENGQEGLEITQKIKPDLILLDIIMPVMDGLEMLKKLRESEDTRKIKVVVLSNAGDFDKIASAMQNGVSTYMVKSDIAIEDLGKKIKEIVS